MPRTINISVFVFHVQHVCLKPCLHTTNWFKLVLISSVFTSYTACLIWIKIFIAHSYAHNPHQDVNWIRIILIQVTSGLARLQATGLNQFLIRIKGLALWNGSWIKQLLYRGWKELGLLGKVKRFTLHTLLFRLLQLLSMSGDSWL